MVLGAGTVVGDKEDMSCPVGANDIHFNRRVGVERVSEYIDQQMIDIQLNTKMGLN